MTTPKVLQFESILRRKMVSCLIACLTVTCLIGCAKREFRIKMQENADGPQRTFSDSAPSNNEIRNLEQAYGQDGERDESGELMFQAQFESDLPDELSGHNGWSRLDGALGSSTFWFEDPRPVRGVWPDLVQRVESGILWLRITKLWAIREFGEKNEQRIERFFEDKVIPGAVDAYLRFTGAGAIMSAQRVGFRVRDNDDGEPLDGDERFRLEVLLPILISISLDAPLESDELHLGFILGLDGNSSREERERAWRESGERIALRFVQQMDPERTELNWSQIRGWGFSLLLFAAQSPKYEQILLDSPAITESEKKTLRSGGVIFPPSPFGVQILGGGIDSLATIELEPAAAPYLTNGTSVESSPQPPEGSDGERPASQDLEFKLQFRDEGGPLFGAPPAYAFWSSPDSEVQTALFGRVCLEGADLAVVVGWENLLNEKDLDLWKTIIEESGRTGLDARHLRTLKNLAPEPPEVLLELFEASNGSES